MGVVLNRPSTVTVGEAVPQLEQAVAEEEPVYVGGPVQPSSIVCLAEFLDPSPAGLLVLGRIGFPAPDAGIDELTEATARRRVFAGYAGWSEGQLDEEVDDGDWIAHAALARRRVHRRARGPVERGPEAHGRGLCAARAHAASDSSVNSTAARRFRRFRARRWLPFLESPLPPPPRPISSGGHAMLKLARWSTTHRKYVVIGWIALLIAVNILAQSAGTSYSNNFTLPNSDAQRAADLLQHSFPAQAGDRDTIVYKVSSGTVLDPAGARADERHVRAGRQAPARRGRDQPLRGRVRRQGDLRRRPDRVRDGRVRRKSQPAAQKRPRTRRQHRPRGGQRPGLAGRARRAGDRGDRAGRASACPPRSGCWPRSSCCC